MKLKKVLAGVLATTTVLALAGCNGNTTTSTPTNNNTSSSAAASSSKPAASSTPAESSAAADNNAATSSAATDSNAGGNTEATGADIEFDESKITDGLELEICTNRTDLKQNGYLDELAQPFEDRYNCTITWTAYQNYDDVKTRMSTDDYGDILNIPGGTKPADYERLFEPLGKISELDNRYWWGDGINDTIYGMPTGGSVSGGFVINKRVWNEAGYDLSDPAQVPKTPEDLITALHKIHDTVTYTNSNGDEVPVQPFQTCYGKAADWILKEFLQWAPSVAGDPDLQTNYLVEKKDIFNHDGPYYKTMKLMFDLYKDTELREADPSTSLWEDTKPALNQGHLACIFVGSWGVVQFQDGTTTDASVQMDDNFESKREDIGFMPLPFTAEDGKQYAESKADTRMAINCHIDDSKKELAKAFIKFFLNETTYAQDNGFIPTLKGAPMPDYLEAFGGVQLFTSNRSPEGLNGVWDNISRDSGVGLDQGDTNNFKCRIAEAAFAGQDVSAMDSILAEMDEKWNATRDANEDYIAYMATLG